MPMISDCGINASMWQQGVDNSKTKILALIIKPTEWNNQQSNYEWINKWVLLTWPVFTWGWWGWPKRWHDDIGGINQSFFFLLLFFLNRMVMSRVISTTATPMPMMEALVMWTPEAVSVKLPASEVESPSFRVVGDDDVGVVVGARSGQQSLYALAVQLVVSFLKPPFCCGKIWFQY